MQIARVFRALPTLTTKRLRLRALQYNDAEAIYAYASDEVVTRYTLFETHTSIDDARSFISQIQEEYANGLSGVWGFELQETGALIGTGGFGKVNERHRHSEIGYSLARPYWNRGLGTEAVREIIQFGFRKLRLLRIEARCHPDNIRSIRLLERVGMKYEGRLRHAYIIRGSATDALVFGCSALSNDGVEISELDALDAQHAGC